MVQACAAVKTVCRPDMTGANARSIGPDTALIEAEHVAWA
jgi:hypothetical protein